MSVPEVRIEESFFLPTPENSVFQPDLTITTIRKFSLDSNSSEPKSPKSKTFGSLHNRSDIGKLKLWNLKAEESPKSSDSTSTNFKHSFTSSNGFALSSVTPSEVSFASDCEIPADYDQAHGITREFSSIYKGDTDEYESNSPN